MTPVSNESGLLDRICHKEQLGVWADELASALALSDFLKEDWTFDDSVDLSKEIAAQLRDIIGAALTHPEFNVTEALAARQLPEPSSSEMRVKGLDQFEEAVRLAEVGEYLYDACAYSYGDGHTEPREFGIEWQWQQSSPNEYGQGQLLAAATKWHEEQAADGIVTEAAKLRTMLTAAPTLSPTVSQPVTGEEVEWTEPPLTCPHIDAAIASGELSAEVAQELATIRDINSQLRYGTWALKARLSDYQALKARLLKLEGRANG